MNVEKILKEVEEKGYAIGCVNTPNMETLRAVVDTVEELNVSIVIDHARIHDPLIPTESIGSEMVEYARRTKVPVCVHLDYGSDYSSIMCAIRYGFSSIMYDLSALPFEGNMVRLEEFTKIAHDLDITAEAELGIMTNMEGDSHGGSIGWAHESIKEVLTDSQQAAEFARETGVDALAVCFGAAHGIYAESSLLDIRRVKTIRTVTPKEMRMIMYGGSGVDGEQVRAAITAGCSKVNYYSYMATATSRHIQKYLNERDGKTFQYETEEESYRSMRGYAKGVLTVFENRKQHWG